MFAVTFSYHAIFLIILTEIFYETEESVSLKQNNCSEIELGSLNRS